MGKTLLRYNYVDKKYNWISKIVKSKETINVLIKKFDGAYNLNQKGFILDLTFSAISLRKMKEF